MTNSEERRQAFTEFVAHLNQPHNPARIQQPTHLADWINGSPLFEIILDHHSDEPATN